MKAILKILIVVLTVCCGVSCKKDQDPAKYSFIGCVVDGELFTAEGPDACLFTLSSKDSKGYRTVESYTISTIRTLFSKPINYCVSVYNHNPLNPKKYELEFWIHWKESEYVYGQEEIPLVTTRDFNYMRSYDPWKNYACFITGIFYEPISGYVIIDSVGRDSDNPESTRIKARFEVEALDGEGNTISVKRGVIDGISVY